MAVSLPMGLRPTGEMISLDYTSEAPSLGKANDIHQVAFLQESNVHFVTTLDRANIVGPEFAKIANVLQVSKMSFFGRAKLRSPHFVLNKAHLYSIITVPVSALHLSHHRRPSLNSGHVHCLSAFLKQLRHAYLLTDNAWKHGLNYNLISISTPDARSS